MLVSDFFAIIGNVLLHRVDLDTQNFYELVNQIPHTYEDMPLVKVEDAPLKASWAEILFFYPHRVLPISLQLHKPKKDNR